MKIATKLKIATLAPLVLALISGSAIFFSNQAVEEAQKSVKTVKEVIDSVNNLNTLVYSYMLYQEERSKQQFLAEHEHITRLMSTIQFRNLREMELRGRLSHDVASMKGLFVKMTTSYERLKLGDRTSPSGKPATVWEASSWQT